MIIVEDDNMHMFKFLLFILQYLVEYILYFDFVLIIGYKVGLRNVVWNFGVEGFAHVNINP